MDPQLTWSGSGKAVNSVIDALLAIQLTGFVAEERQKTYFHVHQPDSSLGRDSCFGHPTASASCLTRWFEIHVLKDSDWEAALSSEGFASQHRHINQQ